MLTDAQPIQIVVDGDGGWSDPAILPTTFVHADGVTTACALADALEGARAGRPRRVGRVGDRAGSTPIGPPTRR